MFTSNTEKYKLVFKIFVRKIAMLFSSCQCLLVEDVLLHGEADVRGQRRVNFLSQLLLQLLGCLQTVLGRRQHTKTCVCNIRE